MNGKGFFKKSKNLSIILLLPIYPFKKENTVMFLTAFSMRKFQSTQATVPLSGKDPRLI